MATDLSFLEPGFRNIAAMAGIAQNIQEAARQKDQLDEQKRSHLADEAIRGRTNDISDGLRKAQEAHDALVDALSINNAGGQATPGASGQAPVAPMGPGASSQGPAPTAPAASGGLMDRLDSGGEGSYQAPTVAAPAANPPAAGAGLQDKLSAAAGIPTGTSPVNHGLTVTHMGQRYVLPTPNEAQMAELGRQATADAAKYKNEVELTGQKPTADLVDKFGLDPKSKYRIADLHSMAQIADYQAQAEERTAKANAPVKGQPLHFESTTNDAGDVETTGRDPLTGVVISREVRKGAGATEAGKHPGASARTATPGQFSAAERDKGAALTKSQLDLDTQLGKIQTQYAKDSKAAASNSAQLDQLKADRVTAVRQAYADHYGRMQQAQGSYEARASELSGNDLPHNDWADRAAAAFAAGDAQPGAATGVAPGVTPAAAVPPKAAPKVATMDDVRAYGKKHNLSDAAALKAFQADRVKIGR